MHCHYASVPSDPHLPQVCVFKPMNLQSTYGCIVLMFYGYMQNAHYFILLFGWVGGGMGGISPFSYFVYIDFSVLM